MDYFITDTLKEDILQIFSLEKSSFSDFFSEKQLNEMLDLNYCIFRTLKINNIIKGYLILYLVENECEIIRICISEDIRKQGYWSILLKNVINGLKEKNTAKIFLEVRESNNSAIKLYEKMDFIIIGKRKSYYQNPCEDAILMAKSLI